MRRHIVFVVYIPGRRGWVPLLWSRVAMMKKDDKKAKDAQPSEQQQQEPPQQGRTLSVLHLPSELQEWSKASWCGGVTYIVIGVVAILLACAAIVATSVAASTERALEQASTGRLVTMVILIVSAIVAIAMVIYAICGVCHKHTKPLHTTAIALVILVIIQAIICGVSIHISQKEELVIEKNIASSFARAKDGDPTQVKIWDHISSGLECCGFYGPEDFRLDPFGPLQLPPDVPGSCCPYYKTSQNTTDERERALCKLTRTYYKTGCKDLVITIVKGLSTSVVIVSSILMVVEVILAILGGILSRKRKQEKHEHIEVVISSKEHLNEAEVAK